VNEPTTTASEASLGERLRQERARLGLNQGELADRLSISKTSQFHYEANKRSPDAKYFLLAEQCGLDILFIITGKRNISNIDASFVLIKRYDIAAAAGLGAVIGDVEEAIGELAFSREWLSKRKLIPDKLAIISVKGDSMAGRLQSGDLMLVNMAETLPRSGTAFVLRQQGELLVKYVQVMADGILRVSSENTSYPSYDIDLKKSPDVEIVGRVVCSNREW
jgi:phage repressor protein C with HTH and peptisase S24 domain